MLITQFICVLRTDSVQRRLLQEKNDDLLKPLALEKAATSESAAHQQGAMREDKVQFVQGARREMSTSKCYRCGAKHDGK